MSNKDDKRLMQCLLIACAFVLVLLYLYFTKGACWEMSKCAMFWLKILISGVFVFISIFSLVCIWCGENKEQYILCCKNKIVQECDIDLLAEMIYAQNDDEVTDVYIINPNKPYDFYEKFILLKDKNIHLCKDYSVFKIKLKERKNKDSNE